jgi:PAS domain S-box-containing protein
LAIEKNPPPIQAQAEGFYQRMMEEVKDYAIVGMDTEGRVIEWNKGAEKIKGYKASEIIGKSFNLFYSEEDRAARLPESLLAKAMADGSVSAEGWRVKKDGSRFWANILITAIRDDTGALIGYSKVTRDLTEKKKADDNLRRYAEELEVRNEELRQSEDRYHKMIAEVQDYAIILLSKNGDVEDWNAGAEYIKGYTAAEIVGRNFRIFYTDEDRIQKLPETLIDLASRKGRAQHEGWRVRKDGTKFWGSVTITALHGSHENVVAFTKVTRDLTDKKIAEDNLKFKNAELEEVNKELNQMNRELSSFAYISSHDLQEPLRKIQTFTSRILEIDEKTLSEKSTDYFKRIEVAAQRMRLLIDDLLSYSRANSAERKYETTDLNKIVADVLVDLETVIEEKKAVIECGPLPAMEVIPFQFHQLLSNLLTNSIKFSRENINPYVLIRSQEIDAERVPGLPKKLSPKYHHLSVVDNGIGFNQEHSHRIFDVFQRLHGREEYAGTGIGLAICKKIVENHQGIINAEGKPGSGATFHIYIPASLPKPS